MLLKGSNERKKHSRRKQKKWKMSRNSHDQVIKIETHALKVHLNCEGCKEKVRKMLKKIEGVYSVEIDTENQMVIVSGSVDPSTLLKKLVKSGKKAELCLPSFNYKLNQEKANMNQIQLLANEINASKNQSMFPEGFMNEIGGVASLEQFPNQNIGIKAVDATIDHHDQMTANRMGNIYMEDDDMPYLINDADYEENGSGFPSDYKHNNLPPMLMTNREQQGHYYNYPSAQKNFLYKQDGHVNYNMTNDTYMHQPQVMNHAFSMSTPYNGYNP